MLLLWTLPTAQANCEEAPDLEGALAASEQAFADLDDAIDTRKASLEHAIKCRQERLDPLLAAHTHRTLALFHFLDEDDTATAASFARYRTLAADAPELPEKLAPAKHPLRKLYEDAQATGATREIAKPDRGSLLIDGEPGAAPLDEPFLLQHTHRKQILSTTLVQPGQPLPSLGAPSGGGKTKKSGPSVPLLVAGGAALAAGIGTYTGAFATRGSYRKAIEANDRDKARSTHTTTNALTVVGLGLMGTGVGLGVAGVL